MRKIVIGMGTCGLSAGAQPVHDRLQELAAAAPSRCEFGITGCIGMCYREPLVEVREGGQRAVYGGVDVKRAEEIFERHVIGGEPIDAYLAYSESPDGTQGGSEVGFLAPQERINGDLPFLKREICRVVIVCRHRCSHVR